MVAGALRRCKATPGTRCSIALAGATLMPMPAATIPKMACHDWASWWTWGTKPFWLHAFMMWSHNDGVWARGKSRNGSAASLARPLFLARSFPPVRLPTK